MNTEDALAYLIVLNHPPIIEKLSEQEWKIGQEHLNGCLMRLADQLEQDQDEYVLSMFLLQTIRKREKVNAVDDEDPDRLKYVRHLNKSCSEMIWQLLGRERIDDEPGIASVWG